jgi:hypothetical protein
MSTGGKFEERKKVKDRMKFGREGKLEGGNGLIKLSLYKYSSCSALTEVGLARKWFALILSLV